MASRPPSKKAPDRKTEVLSIRIDPRARYGLELLSRLQRRSTTGVVEWAIQEAFAREAFDPGNSDYPASLDDEINNLWHINEIERLVALALRRPQLLTFEESRIWKVLKDTSAFWKPVRYNATFSDFDWQKLLPQWDKIGPLVAAAAEKNIVSGITTAELVNAGIDVSIQHRRAIEEEPDIPF